MGDSALLEVLGLIAPSSLEVVKRLLESKMKREDILVALLALSIEHDRKNMDFYSRLVACENSMVEELKNLRIEMIRRGVV
mgnify:CR=1 FL=1